MPPNASFDVVQPAYSVLYNGSTYTWARDENPEATWIQLAAPRNSSMAGQDRLVKVPDPHGGRGEPISAIAGGVEQGLFEVRRTA